MQVYNIFCWRRRRLAGDWAGRRTRRSRKADFVRATAIGVHAVGDTVHRPARRERGGVRIEHERFDVPGGNNWLCGAGMLAEHEKIVRRVAIATATTTKISARVAHPCRKNC